MMRRGTAFVATLIAGALLAGCGSPTSAPSAAPPPEQESVDARTHCGTERWAVKTGSDSDEYLINLDAAPTKTTVGQLAALRPPWSLPPANRVRPTETTVYQLHATLTGYKLESDSDYHLVLSDQGHTMIAEIPSRFCVIPDPLRPGVIKARQEFDARYRSDSVFKYVNVPVTVTGVGFYDFQHGQQGVAPNGVELHPVLNITFG